MKLFSGLLLGWLTGAAIAAEPTGFYVIDLRHTGEAVLHTNLEKIGHTDRPYVVVDIDTMDCCFRFGRAPGRRKPMLKIDEHALPLTSPAGEETYQNLGHITVASANPKHADDDTLAFGVVGMTAVSMKGKRTYEIKLSNGVKPLVVKQCMGAEGVNFRLFNTLADKKPFATYYYALGYDVTPDCR